MKQLVIGLGEVGSAIRDILNCEGYDVKSGMKSPEGQFDVLHVCFPWSDTFISDVAKYQGFFRADMVIVHSSVPVGTCDTAGWVHSPIRGVHPNLKQGILTFVKYFGGKDADKAAKIFKDIDIMVTLTEKAATTEALKLWDTTQYGIMIMLEKEIYSWCIKNGLDPEIVYTDANHTYNIGYESLGRPEVTRPYLKHMDGAIGGHCVIPNAKLLKAGMAELLLEFNTQVDVDQNRKEAL